MHSNDNKWKKVSSDGLKASMKLQGFALSLSLHTCRGLGGDNPEDINSFAVLGVTRRKT